MTEPVETELVARLREHATDWTGEQMPDAEPAKSDPTAGTLRSAADEIERLQAELREACHERDGFHAERDMARERLEWPPDQPYDGIAARDETIAGLQAELTRVSKVGAQKAYTLGCIANEDWHDMTADDARREARAALEEWG